MNIINEFFGIIIRGIYDITSGNYALAIIIFTILTKVILFPLTYKQLRSTKEMNKIKPKYDEIIKKYKSDKQKQGEEVAKLYSEHKINPLGGCLPLLIQIPLILAIFAIVRQPLTYVVNMPQEEINIYTAKYLNKEEVNEKEANTYEIQVAKQNNFIDMRFIGLNLGDIPADAFSKDPVKKANIYSLLIPILSVLASMYQIKRMQKSSQMTEEQKEMQKSMNLTMPILSGVISYTMPLGLGIYWLLGSIIQILQQIVIDKLLKEDKEDRLLLK